MGSRHIFKARNTNPNADSSENHGKRSVVHLGSGSEIVYVPRFLPQEQACAWFDYLDKEIPWTRPLIHVFGRSCLQPRDTCYVASKGLTDLKYSGYQPHAYTWDEYPVLKDILQAVHEALPGSQFNSLLLNRYKSGSDYVAWHSDNEKLYGPKPDIASVSFGSERRFLLKKRHIKKEGKCNVMKTDLFSFQVLYTGHFFLVITAIDDASQGTRGKRLKMTHQDSRSLLLKHGSLLVMRGYTQRDWVHSVPKSSKPISVRINLTFRQILA